MKRQVKPADMPRCSVDETLRRMRGKAEHISEPDIARMLGVEIEDIEQWKHYELIPDEKIILAAGLLMQPIKSLINRRPKRQKKEDDPFRRISCAARALALAFYEQARGLLGFGEHPNDFIFWANAITMLEKRFFDILMYAILVEETPFQEALEALHTWFCGTTDDELVQELWDGFLD